jgi:hypothetical protein
MPRSGSHLMVEPARSESALNQHNRCSLYGHWRQLDERIESLSDEIEALAHQDPACERLMTVPGIGPIISSAMVGDRQWCGVRQGARLRCLARAGAQANLQGRPHDPRYDVEARQSLPAGHVRASGLGGVGQDKELGTLRAQSLDRRRQEEIAPQRAGGRACQQACPHRLGRLFSTTNVNSNASSLPRSSPPLSGASVLSASRLEPLVLLPLASPVKKVTTRTGIQPARLRQHDGIRPSRRPRLPLWGATGLMVAELGNRPIFVHAMARRTRAASRA